MSDMARFLEGIHVGGPIAPDKYAHQKRLIAQLYAPPRPLSRKTRLLAYLRSPEGISRGLRLREREIYGTCEICGESTQYLGGRPRGPRLIKEQWNGTWVCYSCVNDMLNAEFIECSGCGDRWPCLVLDGVAYCNECARRLADKDLPGWLRVERQHKQSELFA